MSKSELEIKDEIIEEIGISFNKSLKKLTDELRLKNKEIEKLKSEIKILKNENIEITETVDSDFKIELISNEWEARESEYCGDFSLEFYGVIKCIIDSKEYSFDYILNVPNDELNDIGADRLEIDIDNYSELEIISVKLHEIVMEYISLLEFDEYVKNNMGIDRYE
jgi:hypothetical protein